MVQYILSVLTAKDMVRHLLVVVIFVPSCKIPVEVELFMRKLWGQHIDNQYLTIIALWATNKMPRCLCIKCERSVLNILHRI